MAGVRVNAVELGSGIDVLHYLRNIIVLDVMNCITVSNKGRIDPKMNGDGSCAYRENNVIRYRSNEDLHFVIRPQSKVENGAARED